MISYSECADLINLSADIDGVLMIICFVVGVIGGYVLSTKEVIVHISPGCDVCKPLNSIEKTPSL